LAPWLAWSGPVGGPATVPADGEEESVAGSIGLGWLFEGFNRVDVEGEALIASDITVLRTSASYEQERGDITVGATLGYTDFDVDYSGSGPTVDSNRSESNRVGQLDLGWKANPNLEITALGRAYDGYPDYRAIWIAEFFRQTSPSQLGYQPPNPWGWAVGAAVAWDMVPGATRVTVDVGYGEGHIVESWGFPAVFPPGPPILERGIARLDTVSGGVVWEQAVNGWLKTENSFRISKITDREPRIQVQTSWAAALGQKVTVRVNAGATRERPDFEAYYAGGLVDVELLPAWHVSLHGRYYSDTGEIETSGRTTAAPDLQSYEIGASLLYDKGDLAVRVYGGLFPSFFGALDVENFVFGDLYRDREWWVTRLAISYSF